MPPDILIVGQGVAGTFLAWQLERAGLSFVIADAVEEGAASRVSAGIINPITGRRLVKSWRIETLLPLARAAYAGLGQAVGGEFWREMKVRRLFADDRERRTHAEKHARGELAPFAGAADESGFSISDAACVDLPGLLAAARLHWQRRGRYREERVDILREVGRYAWVIDCRGFSAMQAGAFDAVPWEFSRGEVLEIETPGLERGVILNRRHWVLPLEGERALVGATHEPGVVVPESTAQARATLEASARELLDRPFLVVAHRAGIRVNLPDKRPVAGRHPARQGLGLCNGLGAKGALWAPWLAEQWARHISAGADFDPEIDLQRFSRP